MRRVFRRIGLFPCQRYFAIRREEAADAADAADASITEDGDILWTAEDPAGKNPGPRRGNGGKSCWYRANPLVSISIPILSASAFDSFET